MFGNFERIERIQSELEVPSGLMFPESGNKHYVYFEILKWNKGIS